MKRRLKPLIHLPIGVKGIVKDIRGGKKARSRLSDLGIIKDARVKVVQNSNGPLIISLADNKVALGFGMANKVMVEEQN